MKRLRFVIAFVLLAAALAWALPDLACPVDGLRSHFTGQYVYIDLIRMAVYQCPRGHRFAVRAR
jgi:hypothetical protein